MNKNKMLTVKELPLLERPYEKCVAYGSGALSDAELLAVMIRSGSRKERSTELAMRILNMAGKGNGLAGLHSLTLKDLLLIHGIGKVKAVQILCVAELSKRIAKQSRLTNVKMDNPNTIAEYYMEDMRHLTTEQSMLLFLDTRNRLIGDKIIASGTVNMSIMSPREIFLSALKAEAVSIVLLHNHPSGDPQPSKEDIHTTMRIKEAGNYIGIRLMDHIVIGDNKYISMKEEKIF